MLAHRGEPLSPIGSLTPGDGRTVAALRGEIYFAAAEEIFTRLTPLMNDDGCLVLDFTGVTRVGPAVKELFRQVPNLVGVTAAGRPRAIVVDPDGVLE
jgi:glutaminase